MKKTELLIKHFNILLERATDTDGDGIDYWKDLNIPACDMQELAILIHSAEKEVKSKEEDELFNLLVARLQIKDSLSESSWIDKSAKTALFEEVYTMREEFYNWLKKK